MTTRRFLVLSLALALGLSASATAATPRPAAPVAQLAAPTTPLPVWHYGVITLGPSSFQVRDCMWSQAYLEYEEQEKELRASLRVTEGFPNVSMAAPLSLPQGAEITRIKIDYFDSDPVSEPSMGVYSIGPTGLVSLVVDTSGPKEFSKGDNTVIFQLKPKEGSAFAVDEPKTLEFLMTLNRSVGDVSLEHALYRVEIRYRYWLR